MHFGFNECILLFSDMPGSKYFRHCFDLVTVMPFDKLRNYSVNVVNIDNR